MDTTITVELDLNELFNKPTNTEDVAVFKDDGGHVVLKSDEEEIGPLALQVGNDDAGDGEGGYAAACQYITEEGERIATESADKVHNHWGVYTRNDDFGTGDGGKVEKRLSIQGGDEVTGADWYKIDTMRMGPRSTDGKMDLIVESAGENDANIRVDHEGNMKGSVLYSQRHDQFRLVSFTGDDVTDVRLHDGNVRIMSGGVEFGASGAKIYEEDGNLYAENDDGERSKLV